MCYNCITKYYIGLCRIADPESEIAKRKWLDSPDVRNFGSCAGTVQIFRSRIGAL